MYHIQYVYLLTAAAVIYYISPYYKLYIIIFGYSCHIYYYFYYGYTDMWIFNILPA